MVRTPVSLLPTAPCRTRGPLSMHWQHHTAEEEEEEGQLHRRNARGHIFENARLTVSEVCLFVLYSMWRPHPRQALFQQDMGPSAHTVVDWSSFCREVCVFLISDSGRPIGGPGCVVEIGEAKVGKRKYNRGRYGRGSGYSAGIQMIKQYILLLKDFNPCSSSSLRYFLFVHFHNHFVYNNKLYTELQCYILLLSVAGKKSVTSECM